MSHREEDLRLSNGQAMWISAFTGRVVSEQREGDCHDLWLGEGGEEVPLTLHGAGWSLRPGQYVTIISGAGKGLERGTPFVAINHDEGKSHDLGDALPNGVIANDLPSWGRAAAVASVGQLLLVLASAFPHAYLPRVSFAGWLVTCIVWGVCDLILTARTRQASLLREVRRKAIAAITSAPAARGIAPRDGEGLAAVS